MTTWAAVEQHPNGTPIRVTFGTGEEWALAEVRHHDHYGDRETDMTIFDLEEGDTPEAVLERFFGGK